MRGTHSSVQIIFQDELCYIYYCFRVLWKKNEVADYEATTYSIFYNNALFLCIVITLSFFLLRNFSPAL